MRFLRALGYSAFTSAVFAVYIEDRGIVPTRTDQIGVDPVTDLPEPIPEPTRLVGKIGKNTKWLTLEGAITEWIGSDTVIDHSTFTTSITAGAAPATITQEVNIVVSEVEDGALNVLTGPGLREGLEDVAAKVVTCGAKLRQRQGAMCGFNSFVEGAMRLGSMNNAEGALGSSRMLIPASDVAALVASFQAAAAATGVAVPSAVVMSFLYLAWKQSQSENTKLPPIIQVAADMQGKGNGKPTPTSSGCPNPKATDTEKPVCESNKCNGQDEEMCTIGEDKQCPCVHSGKELGEPRSLTMWNLLQKIIQDVQDKTSSRQKTPVCDNSDRREVETQDWQKRVAVFCKDLDLGNDKEATIKAGDSGLTGYNDFSFWFDWSSNGGICSQKCEDIFGIFPNGFDCSSSAHSMATWGTLDVDCGDASFKIDGPAGPGPVEPDHPATVQPVNNAEGDLFCFKDNKKPDVPHRFDLQSFKNNWGQFSLDHICQDDARLDYGLDPNDSTWTNGDMFWFDMDGHYCSSSAKCTASGCWNNDLQTPCGSPQKATELLIEWSPDQTGCAPKEKFSMPKGVLCGDIFRRILNDCDGNSDEEWGGILRRHTPHGCVDWRIDAMWHYALGTQK